MWWWSPPVSGVDYVSLGGDVKRSSRIIGVVWDHPFRPCVSRYWCCNNCYICLHRASTSWQTPAILLGFPLSDWKSPTLYSLIWPGSSKSNRINNWPTLRKQSHNTENERAGWDKIETADTWSHYSCLFCLPSSWVGGDRIERFSSSKLDHLLNYCINVVALHMETSYWCKKYFWKMILKFNLYHSQELFSVAGWF